MAEARQRPLDEVLFGPNLDRTIPHGAELAEVISAWYRTWAGREGRATAQKSTARGAVGEHTDLQ
jgi:hypothetical protein